MSNSEYRTFDGRGNNLANPSWGSANTQLLRKTSVDYADKVSSLAVRGDPERTNPRAISNLICRQCVSNPNPNGLSDYVWAWGQFLDHEMDLTGSAEPAEEAQIDVAYGDSRLPKGGEIEFKRSEYDSSTGTGTENPRQQANQLSAYVDATNVYGSNADRAEALRRQDGTGRLEVTTRYSGDLLPFNVSGLPNAQVPESAPHARFFLAGDVRANEHSVLTSMHTLFVREHNRLCLEILKRNPELAGDDEAIYQRARKLVGAQMQAITYNEFLPALLGEGAISEYTGYKDDVDAGIANVFSTACYRLGHSMLSSHIKLWPAGELSRLREAFFKPELVFELGIEPFLGGLASQVMQDIDTRIVDDLREFLFSPPNGEDVLLDLAALNIQRGRDHGLADYNACREAYGLSRVSSFSDITCDRVLANALECTYGDVDSVDPWVGGLAEEHIAGSLAEEHIAGSNVGEFIFTVLKDQFERCRDGDRFWYQIDPGLTAEEKTEIGSTRLSDIILRNTTIEDLPDNVFVVERHPAYDVPARPKTEAEPV